MLSRSLSSFSRMAIIRPPTPKVTSLSRSFITIIENTQDEESIRKELASFTNRAQSMGCDPYPHYRRERLTKSDRRKMLSNSKKRQRSFDKVHSLAEMIVLQNKYKLR